MRKVMMGNHAVSHAVKLCRTDVISAYPITPQTHVVEELSEICANGELDAKFIKVESEHSAMAACIGASQTGARSFTATSSQGLALMHEVLHWAAGARLPIVLVNVNRALGPGWNVWADQGDSLAQRDTGWLQVYCESNQEAMDWTIMAFRIAEAVRIPVMVNYDAFYLSHTYEPVDVPTQEEVDKFLPKKLDWPQVDVTDPHAYNGLLPPGQFMEMKYKMMQATEASKSTVETVIREFKQIFGRERNMVQAIDDMSDKKIALITTGTMTGTSRTVMKELQEEGIPVGLVKLSGLRPFPVELLRDSLAGVEKVAVIDRNFSMGTSGIFAQEIRAALYNGEHRPHVFGYIAGLGGRDVTPDVIKDIVRRTHEADAPKTDHIWIGVKS
jgi:pyruvate/2-oxoacid:ferredoxin oxidoreductase alpha subunit